MTTGPRASRFSIVGAPAILGLVFLLSLPAVTTRIYASDEIQYFAWLRSLAFDHDVSFANEYEYFYVQGGSKDVGFRRTYLERPNENGRAINFGTIGCAVLWAPFYAVGHLAARATGATADGMSHPYVAAVAYGSAVYGFLAVLLSAAIAARVIGRGLVASVAVWVGTPLLFYSYIAPVFAHACSAFAVALFVWCWLRVRERWSWQGGVLLGILGALVAMVREQDVFFLAGPAVDFLRAVWLRRADPGRGQAAALGTTAAAGAAFALAYLPQWLAYEALNGHFGPSRLVARKMIWTAPHAASVLLSPEHGLFAWTPLAALALAGLCVLALGRGKAAVPDAAWIGVCALLMAALQVYVSGAVESWTVAGGFGQRRFVGLTPLLALGLSAAFAALGSSWARRALGVAVALCVWWNLGLMAQFGLHTMDRQQLTLRANARATFVDLPVQAPAIVWQYLTNRASFYGRPRQ